MKQLKIGNDIDLEKIVSFEDDDIPKYIADFIVRYLRALR